MNSGGGTSRMDSSPKGPGRIPWIRKQWGGFPSDTATGTEVVLLVLEGWSTACDAYFNPNGNTIPAATYELRLYACGTNFRFLAAKVTLDSTLEPPPLNACTSARRWELAVGLLAPIATPPAWGSTPPTVCAYAHGQERS